MFAMLHSRLGINANRTFRHTSRRSASTRARALRVDPLEERRLLALVPEFVADLASGGSSSDPAGLTNVGSELYFGANDRLWTTDGTADGTVLVGERVPRSLGTANGHAFFSTVQLESADIGTYTNIVDLWVSDGTAAGTWRLKEDMVDSYGTDQGCCVPKLRLRLADGGNRLFFEGYDEQHGWELWSSDGTVEGTAMVKDIRPGLESSRKPNWSGGVRFAPTTHGLDTVPPLGLVDATGTLYFVADDGEHGQELWKSDGTNDGTRMVKDIVDIPPGVTTPYVGKLTEADGMVYFTVHSLGDPTIALWRSDGTEEGTVQVKDNIGFPSQYEAFVELTNVNGTLFFTTYDHAKGNELWKTDGTAAGTVLVKDLWLGGKSLLANLTDVANTLYFTANDGRELWKSDGTESGTVLVTHTEIDFPASLNPDLLNLTNVAGTLFLAADAGSRRLWRSDGTEANTFPIGDIQAPRKLTNVNGTLYFSAEDGIHGNELWKLAPSPGDTNYDGLVDITDLNNVRNNLGYMGDERPGDTTGDGVVGLDDLNAVRNHFGEGTEAPSLNFDGRRRQSLADKHSHPVFAERPAMNPAAVDVLFAVESPLAPVTFQVSKAARRRVR